MGELNNTIKTSILRIPNEKSNWKEKEINSMKIKIKENEEKIEITKKLKLKTNSLTKYIEKYNNESLELTYESYKTNLKDENLFFVSLDLKEKKIIKIDNLYDLKIKKEKINLNPKTNNFIVSGMRKKNRRNRKYSIYSNKF